MSSVTIEVPYVKNQVRFVVETSLAKEIQTATIAYVFDVVRKACKLDRIKEDVKEGMILEEEDFIKWIRHCSGIQTEKDFRSTRSMVELLYNTFVPYSVDMVDLSVGFLVFLDGTVEEKLRLALELTSKDDFPILTEGAVVRCLTNILLGLYCLFASGGPANTDTSVNILETMQFSASQTVVEITDHQPKLTFDDVWDWYLLMGGEHAPYLKLLDMSYWRHQEAFLLQPATATSDSSSPLVFTVTHQSQSLHIGAAHAIELEELLLASRFTVLQPQVMYDTFLHHTIDGWLDLATFEESLNELTCMTCTNHLVDDDKFMTSMRALFASYLGPNDTKVEAFELAAGFSLFCDGSKSDKLAAGFHYFDTDDAGELTNDQLWRFLRSVIVTVLGLVPNTDNSSLVDVIDGAATEIMDQVSDPTYTFEQFGQWYNEGGFQTMSWLELLDLRKWSFVWPEFNTANFATLNENDQQLQPVSASAYYTAKNIRATLHDDRQVDSDPCGGSLTFDSTCGVASQQQRNGTLDLIPPVCLKNDIVLEFELPLESSTTSGANSGSSNDQASLGSLLDSLCFDNGDLMHYMQLQKRTALQTHPIQTVFQVFEPYFDALEGYPTLERADFETCVDHLLFPNISASHQQPTTATASPCCITKQSLSDEFDRLNVDDDDADSATTKTDTVCRILQRQEGLEMLEALFFAYNRSGTGKIDATEFVSGFLVLCAGSKSDKLSFCFGLFDEDGDGCLTRREMWKFLRSFLTMLLALGNGADCSPEVIGAVCDAACIGIARSLFTDPTLSQGASDAVPVTKVSFEASYQDKPSATSSSSAIVFQFKLTTYDNTTLRIRLRDVAVVYTIAEKLRLKSIGVDALYDGFDRFTRGKSLSKSGFLHAIRSLAPRGNLSSEDQEFLSYHLLRIFSLYETESATNDDEGIDDSGTSGVAVDKLHLISGMSLFCHGSKSTKLGMLFSLFDTHRDGSVSRRALFELLKSVLSILFSFSLGDCSGGSSLQANVFAAERAAGVLVSKVFCDVQSSASISLGAFADWYTARGGYELCPWLELLDLNKWPTKEAMEASTREKPLSYAFDMHEEGSLLHYTEKDIETYLAVLEATQFHRLAVPTIHDAIVRAARPVTHDNGLVVTRSSFYSCIRKLIPRTSVNEEGQQVASRMLARLFSAYDRKKVGKVNAVELACGMSMLGMGSKSQKLSSAFDLIVKLNMRKASSRATAAIPHAMLFLYLRSFLVALMVLCEKRYRRGIEQMYVEADEVIGDVTTKLLHEVTLAAHTSLRTRNRVSFEQFGEWYNSGGYETVSWVELLDVSKWQRPPRESPESSWDENDGVRASDIGLDAHPSDSPSSTPLMRYQVAASELVYTQAHIHALGECLTHVELHLYSPFQLITVIKTFLTKRQAPSTNLLSPTVHLELTREQCQGSILQLCPKHAHCTNRYVGAFVDHLFCVLENPQTQKVLLVHVLCGLLVFTDGNLLDILVHGSALLSYTLSNSFSEQQQFDETTAHHVVPWNALRQCLEIFLKALFACSQSLDRVGGVEDVATVASAGADETISFYQDVYGDDSATVSCEAFHDWFEAEGIKSLPWLGLVVLENWPHLLPLDLSNRRAKTHHL
ncbi:hypothetical protein DYB32_001726 [Aphanomyces invadans]|uniref:EF-hand domain-containing protein n=1 Tax=Aphanomyces invadans TaxID=157072 RepID=A0A418B5A4_9STRA|nr:hypothetical protein DYB32_001726 [Aphanomyces invadans]